MDQTPPTSAFGALSFTERQAVSWAAALDLKSHHPPILDVAGRMAYMKEQREVIANNPFAVTVAVKDYENDSRKAYCEHAAQGNRPFIWQQRDSGNAR